MVSFVGEKEGERAEQGKEDRDAYVPGSHLSSSKRIEESYILTQNRLEILFPDSLGSDFSSVDPDSHLRKLTISALSPLSLFCSALPRPRYESTHKEQRSNEHPNSDDDQVQRVQSSGALEGSLSFGEDGELFSGRCAGVLSERVEDTLELIEAK